MWLPTLLLVMLVAEGVLSSPEPGLLRVPKVYNAVITSNQNLAPSRAYPVIQPVVHRTAIGYVPPFYYTQITPGFAGPQVLPLGPGVLGNRGDGGGRQGERPEGPPARPDEVESIETTDGSSSSKSPPPKKVVRPNSNTRDVESSGELTSAESSEHQSSSSRDTNDRPKKDENDRVPLSFYPNYQSLYYDPYFYPYNAFPPHLAAPGTYYVDYPQPPGILGPLPPPPLPPLGPPGYPVPVPAPGRPEAAPEGSDQESRNQKQKQRNFERREKIPDVPPPPLPTTMRKKAS